MSKLTIVSFFSKAAEGIFNSEYPNIDPSKSSRPNSSFPPSGIPVKSRGLASLLTSLIRLSKLTGITYYWNSFCRI